MKRRVELLAMKSHTLHCQLGLGVNHSALNSLPISPPYLYDIIASNAVWLVPMKRKCAARAYKATQHAMTTT